jgi:hypothetical protein
MDRWVEIDADWFGLPPWDGRIREFVERAGPLWSAEQALHGVCLNIGWLADLVTEWTGRPDQPLPLRSRRFARWASLTYDDLRRFLAQLRRSAAEAGVDDLRLGVLIAGLGEVVAPPDTGAMYDLYSSWHDRHPELYPLDISPLPGPDLDPRVPLRADDYPYATRPGGIRAGEPFPELFGAQWGAVSTFLGLDLIHFRDGFLGPLLYTRVGPYGTIASEDPTENRTWTDAVSWLFRATKEARPDGLVMAYSSGISGTAEWMSGCVDLEAVVADGGLDIFIDQTWGGAWQDWWDDLWKGWTFQQAFLLGHGAQIRGADAARTAIGRPPCRHYKLIETWDGWEPWDTLHDVPGKLEWACWAFSHAAVIGADGRPRVPDGTYISWMNDWNERLIAPEDVAWLARNLDAAEASAGRIEAVFGPLLVHDRAGLVAKSDADPASNASEWIEDHVAMAMKWGAPVLAATRTEWLPSSWPEGAFAQLPLDGGRLQGLDGPVVAVGRADRLDPSLLAAAGLSLDGGRIPPGYRLGAPASEDLPSEERIYLPEQAVVSAAPGTWVGYASDGRPLLAGTDEVLYWQPPDLADPGNPLVPRSQLGSFSPYVEAYRALAARTRTGIRVEPVPANAPVSVHVWRSDGVIHLLTGNLESRWLGDARFPRQVSVVLPCARLGLDDGRRYVLRVINAERPSIASTADDKSELRFTITVPAEGCVVARLESEGSA